VAVLFTLWELVESEVYTTPRCEGDHWSDCCIQTWSLGLYTGKKFILWTDNALVFDRIRAFVAPNAPCPKRSQNDHDMWSQLHRLVRTATGKELFQTVVKVTSTSNQVRYDRHSGRWHGRGMMLLTAWQ